MIGVMTRRHPAVVLAMTATGLAAARSLHRRGVTVYGVDHKRWEIGHHSAEIRKPPFAFEPAGSSLADRIDEWARTQDAPPVLIPADDPHCDFLCAHHEQLRQSCLVPEGYRPEVAGSFVDKRRFYQRCHALGIDLPRTLFPADLAELEESSRDLLFPAILKPAHSHLWRKAFRGKKVIEVGSRDELLGAFRSLGDLRSGMTVQEVVPGAEREIFVCAAYFGRDGAPRALLTARKARQYPPDFGSGSLLRSEWRSDVADLSVDLVRTLGYKGICGTEYKPDPRDSKWKLIEVNPRPTLWFALCRAAGCDVVFHAYCDLIGQPIPPQLDGHREGVYWQYFLRDLLSLGHRLRQGDAGWRECTEALSLVHKEEAVASLRDLPATVYYPLYGFRQWRAHARGLDTGP